MNRHGHLEFGRLLPEDIELGPVHGNPLSLRIFRVQTEHLRDLAATITPLADGNLQGLGHGAPEARAIPLPPVEGEKWYGPRICCGAYRTGVPREIDHGLDTVRIHAAGE